MIRRETSWRWRPHLVPFLRSFGARAKHAAMVVVHNGGLLDGDADMGVSERLSSSIRLGVETQSGEWSL